MGKENVRRDQTLEQVAQRGSGDFIFGNIQNWLDMSLSNLL